MGTNLLCPLELLETAVGANGDVDRFAPGHVSVLVGDELAREDRILSGVGAELVRCLFVTIVGAVDTRPCLLQR